MKVLSIGGATLDLFLNYSGANFMSITKKNMETHYLLFQSGEKIEVDKIIHLTGGGATNSATSFKRLGFQASCFCAIGSDEEGVKLKSELKKEGIDHTYVTQSTTHQTGVSFIINSLQGDHTIFAYRGANNFLELNKIPIEEIKRSNQLYITSLSNQSAQLLPHLVTHAHENKIPVAVNPGISQLTPQGAIILKQSLLYIDTLILNYREAKTFMMTLVESDHSYKTALACTPELTSCTPHISDEQPYLIESLIPHEDLYFSIKNFFKEVLKMGPKIVIITNGCNGVYMATNEEIFFHPSMKVKVENTVGAGDAFGSCFVGSLLLGHSLQDALRNGIVNSASVLSYLGAKQGLLTHEQLNEKVKTIDPKLLRKFSF